jgi:hypothetical protein
MVKMASIVADKLVDYSTYHSKCPSQGPRHGALLPAEIGKIKRSRAKLIHMDCLEIFQGDLKGTRQTCALVASVAL